MLASPGGYCLAPAFDLVPDICGRGEHTLGFQYGLSCPTRAQLISVAKEWAVQHAGELVDQVTRAVGRFAGVARKLQVRTGKPLDSVREDIRKRLELLG